MTFKILRRSLPALLALLMLFGLFGCSKAPEKPVRTQVLYMSDTQSDPDTVYDYSVFGTLLRAAGETAPDADTLIIGGDLINEDGDPAEWEAFFEAGGAQLGALTVLPVVGNHTSGADIFTEKFKTPANGPTGFEHSFYSFDRGAVHFVMLDSLTMGSAEPDTVAAISAWLRDDLATTDAPWVVAVLHHPMYPFSGNYKDEIRAANMQTYYLPLLEEGGVDVILCGHEHMYSRTVPLTGGSPDAGGIVQITGTSGGKHYDLPESERMAFRLPETSVYTVLTADADTLTIETYTADGTLADSFTCTAAETE